MYARIMLVDIGPGMNTEAKTLAERWTASVATLPGFVDVKFLLDEDSGRYGFFSLWDTREDAERAGEDIGSELRATLIAEAGSLPVARIFEVYESKALSPERGI